MIKGYVLIGAAILALCNTGAYAASLPIDAKAGVVGRAAISDLPTRILLGLPAENYSAGKLSAGS